MAFSSGKFFPAKSGFRTKIMKYLKKNKIPQTKDHPVALNVGSAGLHPTGVKVKATQYGHDNTQDHMVFTLEFKTLESTKI